MLDYSRSMSRSLQDYSRLADVWLIGNPMPPNANISSHFSTKNNISFPIISHRNQPQVKHDNLKILEKLNRIELR
jgi:hypothetical protein